MSRVHLAAEILQPYLLNNPYAVFDLRREQSYFDSDYFLGRIQFRIDQLDLGPTSPIVAVLGFAIRLKVVLNRLSEPGSQTLPSMLSHEDLRFSRDQDSDRIVVTMWDGQSVSVGYDDLLAAADRFLQGLLDKLSHTFPQLTENEAYPRWRSL